jgi:hypothetical protein
MDPVTGLNVACNALQLFEVAWKLISGARAIHSSQDGSSLSTKTLDAVANDVAKLSGFILVQGNWPQELEELSRLSGTVAGKLSDLLSTLKAKRPHRKWQSFRVALREIWTKDQVKEFTDQIHQLQTQSTTHIQFLMMCKTHPLFTASLLIFFCLFSGIHSRSSTRRFGPSIEQLRIWE